MKSNDEIKRERSMLFHKTRAVGKSTAIANALLGLAAATLVPSTSGKLLPPRERKGTKRKRCAAVTKVRKKNKAARAARKKGRA